VRYADLSDERTYLEERAAGYVARQAGKDRPRRDILKLAATAVPALVTAAMVSPAAAAQPTRRRTWAAAADTGSPIVKPLPSEWFINYGTNAEMRWDSVDFGYLTPAERFFVRDHTATPIIDPRTWHRPRCSRAQRTPPAAPSPRPSRTTPADTCSAPSCGTR
jgi:hypothetical protein